MVDTIYSLLTREFNQGRHRAILSSGQAVVLHRLAIMSKDGDWIVRFDEEATQHVLTTLEKRESVYRFGAPLDERWLKGGWSSHFEFTKNGLRVRTDFVSSPPRISEAELAGLWKDSATQPLPFVDAVTLARLKMTMREKDYPVIGELARRMTSPEDQALFSRSARDLMELAAREPSIVTAASARRPLLHVVDRGRDALEKALDEERRHMIRADENRMAAYAAAAAEWRKKWPEVLREIENLPLLEAHSVITARAGHLLPTVVSS
jgi:hypothetical protein